jgi:putative nucleotidyltransferase with HDIG domain
MHRIFDKWLYNCTFYRNIFFVLFSFSVLLSMVIPYEQIYFIFYIFSALFLGIGFYNRPVFLIFFSGIEAACRVFIQYKGEKFFLIFLTYLLVSSVSAGLMRYIQKVKNHTFELKLALVNALDSRDSYTKHHSESVSIYSVQIAEKMNLSKKVCDSIRIGGLLHDIGKIGIPEQILTKSDKLTENEYNLIKTHTRIGYEMLKHVSGFKESGILDIVLYHHERYDGKGYPSGLKGSEIPLVARIVAVADTFDAMTSRRVYRNEFNLEYTLNVIRQNKGTQFDPEVVDAFLSIFNQEKDLKVENSVNKLLELL